MMRSFIVSMLLVVALSSLWAAPAEFRLRDYLGHAWQHEAVTFPLEGDGLASAKAGQALCGQDGKAVPYQLVTGATPNATRIAFQTDLPPYETRAFRFTDTPAVTTTDLQITETEAYYELTNAVTGIRVAKMLALGQGPIVGVRLPSGTWATGSRLATMEMIEYSAKVVARGPVFSEVVCRAHFGDKHTWELRLRLYAGEPVVLVDETSAVDGPAVTFSLDLQQNFNPDTMLYRLGKSEFNETNNYGKNVTWKIADGEVYRLEPWLRWQQNERQGNYFGLYREDSNDLLAIAAREAGAWVDPTIPDDKRVHPRHTVSRDNRGLHLDFPLKIGQRKWMYITLPKEPCLAQARDEKIIYQSPLPYQYLIKYGHFPLDMVKDYVLEWDASKETHPRLLITEKDLDRYLASVKKDTYSVESALSDTQASIRVFLEQAYLPYGSAPHMWSRGVFAAISKADIALRAGEGSPEARQRLRAQLAFLGYTINRPEYWSPERGYVGTANMTTMVALYRMAAGALLASHPCSQQWVNTGLSELKRELTDWSDENGGWLEAPHYAMVSYDLLLSGMLMAYNSTGDETLFSPRMRKVIEWFGKISTPPDARFAGFRHFPPIGDTWLFEPSGQFGTIAYLWKDRDPEFSAQMQWLWQQHRSWPEAGIGGGHWGTQGYRTFLADPALPAKAPNYGSELFPQTGVILRNVYASDRETTLHMIAGPHHDHYDSDSGSITVWGKGRIVADDFGYIGLGPMANQSMVDSPHDPIMIIRDFSTAPRLDYVCGEAGSWIRQIVFVKDANPLAPNYFVMTDSLLQPVPATWRLWCTAQEIRFSPQRALAVGKEDVDTDVFFLQPQGLALTTEDKTISTVGLNPEGNQVKMSTTQKGIIANIDQQPGIGVVLYPRLRDEPAPTVTSLAGGKVVKVQHALGTDYVFLATEPFTFTEGKLTFTGTVGAVLMRGGKPEVILASPARVTVNGETVMRDQNERE